MQRRYLAAHVEADLADKMAFIGGPRQVGKTTLALSLLGEGRDESSPAYLNWDALADREAILGERRAAPACGYFRERTKNPRFYQVHVGAADFGNPTTSTRVLPFATFCGELALP
ncbi:MAG: hypothetical protein HY360_15280 [Verrucomicrobia bacterium]|nr:hypothetical protein [Verrucomicrobiota bacterium]